jgi:hypothetical protein
MVRTGAHAGMISRHNGHHKEYDHEPGVMPPFLDAK